MHGDEGLNVPFAMDMAYRSGVREERERIIKLLEETRANFAETDYIVEEWALQNAIALIKGENND